MLNPTSAENRVQYFSKPQLKLPHFSLLLFLCKKSTTLIPQVQSHHPDCPWDWRSASTSLFRAIAQNKELPDMKDYMEAKDVTAVIAHRHLGMVCKTHTLMKQKGATSFSYREWRWDSARKQMCATFSCEEQICPRCTLNVIFGWMMIISLPTSLFSTHYDLSSPWTQFPVLLFFKEAFNKL